MHRNRQQPVPLIAVVVDPARTLWHVSSSDGRARGLAPQVTGCRREISAIADRRSSHRPRQTVQVQRGATTTQPTTAIPCDSRISAIAQYLYYSQHILLLMLLCMPYTHKKGLKAVFYNSPARTAAAAHPHASRLHLMYPVLLRHPPSSVSHHPPITP